MHALLSVWRERRAHWMGMLPICSIRFRLFLTSIAPSLETKIPTETPRETIRKIQVVYVHPLDFTVCRFLSAIVFISQPSSISGNNQITQQLELEEEEAHPPSISDILRQRTFGGTQRYINNNKKKKHLKQLPRLSYCVSSMWSRDTKVPN